MNVIAFLNRHILWGVPMLLLMMLTGFHLTIRTKGMLFRRFGTVMKQTLGSIFHREKPCAKGAITPFQALSTALASTVGTGNIAGVSTAIAIGGPGAVFWMWIPALLGMVTKYSEITLAVNYRERNGRGEWVGGAMYYIEKGLHNRPLAVFFCVCGSLCALCMGNMVQVNTLAHAVNTSFGGNALLVGAVTAFIASLILLGGIKRIASASELFVPLMTVFYITFTLIVLLGNATKIPYAFSLIFRYAFTHAAARGGFAGASVMTALRIGTARGVFTNEAGLGSSPTAHAAADTDHPARQGLWGAFEVFTDTIVMCTLTALVILSTGVWECSDIGQANLTQAAFAHTFGGGSYIVTICLIAFVFETITAWYYYGAKCFEYITHGRFQSAYLMVYIAATMAGSIISGAAVWELADLCNGLMALPNLAALNLLAPSVGALTTDFFKRKES